MKLSITGSLYINMPKTIDIIHQRGDSFSRILRLDSGVLTSSFDEVWFTVRTDYAASTVTDETGSLSSATLTGGQITETGTQEFTITINSPNWTVGRLVYDVQARTTSGQIFTLTKGIIRVTNDVTRSI